MSSRAPPPPSPCPAPGLEDGEFSVGRAHDNGWVLAGRTVSRRHCPFAVGPQGATVTDLGSMNGTWVDGQALAPYVPVPLRGGEVIQIGECRVLVTLVDDFDSLLRGTFGCRDRAPAEDALLLPLPELLPPSLAEAGASEATVTALRSAVRPRRAALSAAPGAEPVDAAVFCPPWVPRGSDFLVQVFLYQPDAADVAEAQARQADAASECRGAFSLPLGPPRGTRVDLRLEMSGLGVAEPDAVLDGGKDSVHAFTQAR